ncbi:MAG: hypothetical protein DLM64_15560 [Solirubrobacterales bacterium]|nr:MAG: hypothetical protein DLM64_15560 [Solirubrobacterales bacterium]
MARRIDPRPASDLRYIEASRRVRARLAATDVADSTNPLLVWEPGRPVPLYAFPRADVDTGLLSASEHKPSRAHPIAEAWSAQVDGRTAEAAAWAYDDPELADYITIDWQAMDAWFEEEDEVFVHPRDPFHRVEVRASSRHVRIEADGVLLAESAAPTLLFETALPTRFYLPADEVRTELLEPTATRSKCPYKGEAVYWSARVGDRLLEDVVWSYPDPLVEVERIRGLMAFFDEHVDVTVDGERQRRPQTPWSRKAER